MRKWLTIPLMMLSLSALAAPKADLWPHWQGHDETNATRVDHGSWSTFLGQYVDSQTQPYRLDYARVSKADRKALNDYLIGLQKVIPQRLARAEQQAYWINLYNAATVQLVLERYPVKSITKIKHGLFSFGPWDKKILRVDGQELTLNNIEHRILRPIFQDPRLHYALNCASIGCPNLATKAYNANQLDAMLDEGARAYINSPRGVDSRDDKLVVSSIYEWFAADFGGDEAGVLAHLLKFADKELIPRLARHTRIDAYEYDWSLNDRQ